MTIPISQVTCAELGSIPPAWRFDSLLFTPTLSYPRDGANICLEADVFSSAQIDLIWLIVPGATQYVLEWCNNSSFEGPSLRAVITPLLIYSLVKGVDIRVGETVYWRVSARDGFGAASDKSIARSVKYDCGDAASKEDLTKDKQYDVVLKVHGDDYMKCCESKMWSVELSYICKSQLDQPLLTVASITWSLGTDPSLNSPEIAESTSEFAIVRSCADTRADSQIFEVEVTVLFNEIQTAGTFSVTEKRKVFLDCHTPPRTQPWANYSSYPPALCVPYEYYDQYPIGDLNYVPFYSYYGYNYMLLAVGPVYKVPVPEPACPPSYVEFGDCCECFPPRIPFQVETSEGTLSGMLVKDGSNYNFVKDSSASITGLCPAVQTIATLACTEGAYSFTIRESCIEACHGDLCDGGLMLPEEIEGFFVTYDCEGASPAVTSSGQFTFIKQAGGNYRSTNINLCNNLVCYYYCTLDFGDGSFKIFKTCVTSSTTSDEVLTGTFAWDCQEGKAVGTFTYVENNDFDCCGELTFEVLLCTGAEYHVLKTDVTFPDCQIPSYTTEDEVFTLDATAEEVADATVRIGGSLTVDGECVCQDRDVFHREVMALEARVNIPLGRGMFSDGLLQTDLVQVRCELVSGDAGDLDTPCSYLYDIYDWYNTDEVLAQNQSPWWTRDPGSLWPALVGLAVRVGGMGGTVEPTAGDWQLFMCDEVMMFEEFACAYDYDYDDGSNTTVEPTTPSPEGDGACCYGQSGPTNCIVTSLDDCNNYLLSVFYGSGTDCDPSPCGVSEPTGACCFGSGLTGCMNTTQAHCATLSGDAVWQGYGTDCATVTCSVSPVLGTCCDPVALMTECISAVPEYDCENEYLGYWIGPDTTCFDCITGTTSPPTEPP